MRQKLIQVHVEAPGLSKTGANGYITKSFPGGALYRGFLLKGSAKITVTDEANAVASLGGLGNLFRSINLDHGSRNLLPANCNGWLFQQISEVEQGSAIRSILAPVTTGTHKLIWCAYIPFSNVQQYDGLAGVTLATTSERGLKIRLDMDAFNSIWATPPDAYTVDEALVEIYGDQVNEVSLITSQAYQKMFPPRWFIAKSVQDAIQQFTLSMHRQPGESLDSAFFAHAVDTAPARFLEYGMIELKIGSTQIDFSDFEAQKAVYRAKTGISNADNNEGRSTLLKNPQHRLSGLVSVSEKEVGLTIDQTGANTRDVYGIFKLQMDSAIQYAGEVRMRGLKMQELGV